MSRTYPVEFAIIGVSRHLAKGCFQLLHVTPGLYEWASDDELANGMATTPAKMQSAVVGDPVLKLRQAYRGSMYFLISQVILIYLLLTTTLIN